MAALLQSSALSGTRILTSLVIAEITSESLKPEQNAVGRRCILQRRVSCSVHTIELLNLVQNMQLRRLKTEVLAVWLHPDVEALKEDAVCGRWNWQQRHWREGDWQRQQRLGSTMYRTDQVVKRQARQRWSA
ncbi:hypothetical protein B0H17DRAFT_1140934 [Mycena rosella]|uniref:Uncharacterized protein n=1 Tax=Mycena rosella TaxID=1033263 RepID=A0AAD7D295_MYCRO|nr:hypothetical protein B0H17DRAFT_1140934 [Mycena rosella]